MTRGTRPRRTGRRSAPRRRSARCAPSTSSWRRPGGRARARPRRWSRSSATLAPRPSDERADADRGRQPEPGFAQPSAPGLPDLAQRSLPARPFGFAIDVTDCGLDDGAPRARSPGLPRGRRRLRNPDRVDYQVELHDRSSTHATARATAPTSRRSPPATTPRPGPPTRTAPASTTGSAWRRWPRIGVSKIFRRATGDRPRRPRWSPATRQPREAPTRGRAHLEQLVGTWRTGSRLGPYSVARARVRPAGARRPVRHSAATRRWSRSSRPATTATTSAARANEGYGSIAAEGEREERDHRRGLRGRARRAAPTAAATTDAGADSARDIANFSSRGPTDDGRLKPDLVAPGTHVTGARPQHGAYNGSGTATRSSSRPTRSSSGTSQAAPQVAGRRGAGARLVRATRRARRPSPAMTKALLINTATDLAGGNNGKGDTIAAGPNADQGWGRVDVGAAIDSTSRAFLRPVGRARAVGRQLGRARSRSRTRASRSR